MINYIISFITLYQRYLSPDHSRWGNWRYPYGYCHFQPSCSEYAKQALFKHGLFIGGVKSILRILRCNPFSAPAIDLVEKKKA